MAIERGKAPDQVNPQPLEMRWWDFSAAILLLVAMFTAASRLDATNWASDLAIVPFLAVFGTLCGLALGQSRFPTWVAILYGVAYGIFFILWQLGGTLDDSLPWKERLLAVGARSNLVLDQIALRANVADSILFILLMAILFWAFSLQAGYVLTRRGNAWWAVLPTGLALFFIHTFDPLVSRRSLYLAVYLFFALTLIARLVYLHNRARWKEGHTALPPHLGLDFIRFTLVAVTLIVLIAWAAPAVARSLPVLSDTVQPARQAWAEVRARWKSAFASLRSTVGIYTDSYGETLPLGRGSSLSDTPALVVSPPTGAPIGIRYYWRATVYDSYIDGQWSDSIFDPVAFDPAGEPLKLPEEDGRWEDAFEFIPVRSMNVFYAPPQPFWVSQAGNTDLAENSDGTIDVAGFTPAATIRPRQAYQVQSSMTQATTSQLRQAGLDYPTWISDRYLSLPDSITARTRELADTITTGLETPYDKVIAITNYLRENIEYQETVPQPPGNQEPVDWFLFDLQKGFCNYYATAEVVLLRAAGIPARLAVGYAQGERQEEGTFLVRQRDAHSWPEVYFPSLGWVEFEPTVSQPEIIRISGENDPSASTDLGLDEELEELRRLQRDELAEQRSDLTASTPGSSPANWTRIGLWLTGAVILAILGFLIWKNRKRFSFPALPIVIETFLLRVGLHPPQAIRHWAWIARLPPLSKSYQEINRALARLGENPPATHTPAERARRLSTILPPAEPPVELLLNEYQIATFSQQTPDYNTARQAGDQIRSLSWKASVSYQLKRLRGISLKRRMKPN